MNPATELGIVADDLTGGAAIAGEIASSGNGVDVVSLDAARTLSRSTVVDTASRYMTRERATERVGSAMCVLARAGAQVLMKKVDSTLKGNVAAELEQFARCIPGPTVIAPACPEVEISLHGGIQQTRGGKGADVARIIARAVEEPAILQLREVRQGVGNISRWFASNRDRVVLADSETQSDLDAIAEAGIRAGISAFAGTYGLGAALARARGHQPGNFVHLPVGRRVTVVVGSSSPVSAMQVARLVENGAHEIVCTADTIVKGDTGEETQRVAAAVRAAAANVTVIHTDPARTQDAVQAWGKRNGYGARDLAEHFAAPMCAAIEANRADSVVIVGGETTGAVLNALGVGSFEVAGEAAPGVPVSTTTHPLLPQLLTKPGAFGSPDVLADVAAGRDPETIG